METDAPDIPLAGHRGEDNLPEYLPEVLAALAALRGESSQPYRPVHHRQCQTGASSFGLNIMMNQKTTSWLFGLLLPSDHPENNLKIRSIGRSATDMVEPYPAARIKQHVAATLMKITV